MADVCAAPAREESERAVLGAALHGGPDNAAAARLRPLLPFDAFTVPAHVTIWQVVCDLVDLGRPVDASTMADELKGQHRFEQIGGAAYLDSLIDALPVQLDLDGHVALLLEAVRLRRWEAADAKARAALRSGAPLLDVRRLADDAGHELLTPERSPERGDALALVHGGGSTQPVRVPICGRGVEDSKQTDLGWLIGSLYPGQIALVAGPQNVGKTAVMLSFAYAMAHGGIPVGYIPLEETPEELEMRLGGFVAWVDVWRIQSGHYAGAEESDRVAAAVDALRALPLWIQWTPGATGGDVGSAIRDLVHRHGVKAVFVDYVQAICGGRDEYEAIRANLGELERAMGRDCACFLGSQINREGTKSGDPQAHHMRGSGTLEERARKVIVVSKATREESEIGDDGKTHIARREVKVSLKKNKGPEGDCFGWVHRLKGMFWPGYAPPPWVQSVTPVEPEQRRFVDYTDPSDRMPDDGGPF